MRVAEFHCACEADSVPTTPFSHPNDKLEYRAPDDEPISFASDMFSVGVTLFEMATGELPNWGLDRDQLLASVDDPRKHELLSIALHDQPSKRPTAEHLRSTSRCSRRPRPSRASSAPSVCVDAIQ